MRHVIRALPAFAFLACWAAAPLPAQDKGGSVGTIDGLESKAPAEWKEETPTNKLRYKQFRLPAAKGDKEDAEVIIFRGITGSAEANIKRWKEMFIPPEGKKLDDVAKVTPMKIGSLEAYYLDVAGTYKFKERPFDPQSKEVRRANTRMIAVQLEGKTAPYQIRLVGPVATVTHYKEGFDQWLKAFK